MCAHAHHKAILVRSLISTFRMGEWFYFERLERRYTDGHTFDRFDYYDLPYSTWMLLVAILRGLFLLLWSFYHAHWSILCTHLMGLDDWVEFQWNATQIKTGHSHAHTHTSSYSQPDTYYIINISQIDGMYLIIIKARGKTHTFCGAHTNILCTAHKIFVCAPQNVCIT